MKVLISRMYILESVIFTIFHKRMPLLHHSNAPCCIYLIFVQITSACTCPVDYSYIIVILFSESFAVRETVDGAYQLGLSWGRARIALKLHPRDTRQSFCVAQVINAEHTDTHKYIDFFYKIEIKSKPLVSLEILWHSSCSPTSTP